VGTFVELMAAIRYRRSVREFTQESVARDVLLELVDAAILAPSARNEQLWRFFIVTNPNALSHIAKEAKTHMLQAMREKPEFEAHRPILENDEFNVLYHAPALVIIAAPRDAQWGTEDCAMAAQNMMLAAAGVGLGTCWIGFAQMWLNTPAGKRTIDAEREDVIVAPIIVGHPKSKTPATPRNKPQIHWII